MGIAVCPTAPPSQSWRTFLTNHADQIAAADFFVVPTATCRLLFVLVILAHERRRVLHVAVTDHPTAAWTAQQLREAFPCAFGRRQFFVRLSVRTVLAMRARTARRSSRTRESAT